MIVYKGGVEYESPGKECQEMSFKKIPRYYAMDNILPISSFHTDFSHILLCIQNMSRANYKQIK